MSPAVARMASRLRRTACTNDYYGGKASS